MFHIVPHMPKGFLGMCVCAATVYTHAFIVVSHVFIQDPYVVWVLGGGLSQWHAYSVVDVLLNQFASLVCFRPPRR